MWGKIFIIITNLSSLITLYYGYKYKEYTITICILVTSLLSLIFHTFTEYPTLSNENLNFLRLLDFYYSYKSIQIVSTKTYKIKIQRYENKLSGLKFTNRYILETNMNGIEVKLK